MVNAAMVNAIPRVSNASFPAGIFPFWAGFRTSEARLNIHETRMLTGFMWNTELYYIA
jgi:hypothetical protein